MREYTFAAIASVVLVVLLDRALRTRLTGRVEFWVFMTVMFGFKLLFNGYLTWRPIVIYGERFYLGMRVWTIPLEDFLFGFSMITLCIVLWEVARSRLFRSSHHQAGAREAESRAFD